MRLIKWTIALAFAGLLAAPAFAQQPVKIRVAWTAPVSNWASILLEKKDLAKHLGKSYTLEPVRYAGTPLMITALANGELEIANLAYSTIAIAIKNAGLEDLRVIADEFRDGVEGRYTNEYYVLRDGPIQKVSDLKGKVVATNAAGSAVDVAMKAMLRKAGLEDKRDYTVLEAPFPTMRAMLAEKKVDLIPAVLPLPSWRVPVVMVTTPLELEFWVRITVPPVPLPLMTAAAVPDIVELKVSVPPPPPRR